MAWINPLMLVRDRYVYWDAKDIGELDPVLRDRIYTATVDAKKKWYRFSQPLYLNSGARSPWQQYLLREERVGAAHAFDRAYPASPRTAIPYSSQHQKRKAADMAGYALSWLIAHRYEYGLELTVSSENWHFEARGTPTVRILRYPGKIGSAVDPTPTPTSEEFTVDAEARAALKAIADQNATQIGWMQRFEADTDARFEQLETQRFEPTTRRTRQNQTLLKRIAGHLGLSTDVPD